MAWTARDRAVTLTFVLVVALLCFFFRGLLVDEASGLDIAARTVVYRCGCCGCRGGTLHPCDGNNRINRLPTTTDMRNRVMEERQVNCSMICVN